jgi:CMP-N,N'-diacetyllegionaminic acid synthase
MKKDILFLIPARGGSKGLPKKNIKLLGKFPLIIHTLNALKNLSNDQIICVSTDDKEIISVVENYGYSVPFIRPKEYATDQATSSDVIKHALEFYSSKDIFFDKVVLLQPTSPLRTQQHIKEALELFDDSFDVLVSVKETASNPYYVLFEEDNEKFLIKTKNGSFTRRQDCPKVYELNGAIYIYKADLLYKNKPILKMKKYLMDESSSIDIDNEIDFIFTQVILESKQKNKIKCK